MNKRIIAIHLDPNTESTITGSDIFKSVSRLNADEVIVIGTPSAATNQSIASYRNTGVPVEVKAALSSSEGNQLHAKENMTQLFCRP